MTVWIIKLSEVETVIHELEKLGDGRVPNDIRKARLIAAQNHLQAWLIRREMFWKQKARSYGISLKDHNTKFFHASTLFRRKKNEIVQIKTNGRNVHSVSSLKTEIRDYFA